MKLNFKGVRDLRPSPRPNETLLASEKVFFVLLRAGIHLDDFVPW